MIGGEDMTFSVLISTFPLASIAWYHQDKALTDTDNRVTITDTLTQDNRCGPLLSTFQRTSVLPQDSGSYTVTATNEAGSDSVTFTVVVKGERVWLTS